MNNTRSRIAPRWSLFAGAVALALFTTHGSAVAQQSFKNPEDAVQALVEAARAGDMKKLISVLGPDGRDIASSGDKVADSKIRAEFLNAYDAKHQIAIDGDTKAELLIGQNEWPFPVPVMRKGDAWRFNTAAGREEILDRRIGRNELDVIQVCAAYVDAQNEYASIDPQRNGAYAQRVVSTPNKKDGLYWPATAGGPESPLGEAAARASAEGYRFGKDRIPYHGYYYGVLTKQGSAAPGGAIDYVVKGNMIGGFALVAFPAQYGNSGVMTFIVNHTGKVFQKDLGPRTSQIAARMTSFNPDPTWQAVDVTPIAAQ